MKRKKRLKLAVGVAVIGVGGGLEGWRGRILMVDHTWIVIQWITDDQGASRDGCQPGRIPIESKDWLALDSGA